MKKRVKILIFLGAIVLVIYSAYICYMCFNACYCYFELFKGFLPEKSKEIHYTLNYSVNGEEFTVSETAVFHCSGYGLAADILIPWPEPTYEIYIPSKESKKEGSPHLHITLLDLSDVDTTEVLGRNALYIYFDTGISCSDFLYTPKISPNFDNFYYWYVQEDGITQFYHVTSEEAEELFGLKVISFDYEIK